MAVDIARLMVHVGADTRDVESGLARASKAVSGFASGMALGMAGAGVAVAGFAAAGVKGAADIEQAVANISTIKPEINTGAVFASLNQMSTKIPQSAAQLGDALYNVFSSVDVSSEAGLALVEKFSKGAVGASTDAQTFGTAAMGVMNAYKLSVGDADHISDVFFNTVKSGVVTGQELAANLGIVTQSAKAAGVDLDTMGAMIAGVTKEGGPAAQNMNNLANMFQKIVTKDAAKGFKALGISVQDAAGDIRPVLDVMGDLKTELDNLTEAERASALQTIFPDAQARMGAQTIMSQLDNVYDYLKANQTQVGSTEEAYKKMSSTFQSQSKLLGNTFQSIMATVGGKLLPAITPLVTAFSEWLPGAFEKASKAVGPLFDTLGELFDYFKADNKFDLMGSLFGPEVGPKIDEVVRGLKGIATAILEMTGAVLTLDWSKVTDKAAEMAPLVKESLGKIATEITGFVTSATEEFAKTDFGTKVLGTLKRIADGLKPTFDRVAEGIKSVQDAFTLAQPIFKKMQDGHSDLSGAADILWRAFDVVAGTINLVTAAIELQIKAQITVMKGIVDLSKTLNDWTGGEFLAWVKNAAEATVKFGSALGLALTIMEKLQRTSAQGYSTPLDTAPRAPGTQPASPIGGIGDMVSRMVASSSSYSAAPVMLSRSTSGLQPVHLHIVLSGGDQVEELFGDPRTVQRILRHLGKANAVQGARV